MLERFLYRHRRLTGALVLYAVVIAMGLAVSPFEARGQDSWILVGEGAATLALSEPQNDLYGPGISGSVGLLKPIAPWFLAGLRVRGALLFDGDPPADVRRKDPELGTLATLTVAARFRLPGRSPARGVGPWLEVAGGGGFTGDLLRPSVEAAVGWGFEVGILDLAPVLRYVQVVEGDSSVDDRDAHLAMLGVEVTLGDSREPPEAPPPPPPAPVDTDGDGLLDPDDACPSEPEDIDHYEDEDGCPEPDNDGDGILDDDDVCPLLVEDVDGFEDEDGCPDPDNDADNILDVDDRCPNEAEVVNGIEDEDGCPDEGVIEFKGDRIVLEERVLFDFERARVKSGARPVIEAIVTLWRQHPEWVRLRVEGHADSRGNERFNLELSERRAKNVLRALVRAGIPSDIIVHKGFGSSRPRDAGETPEAYQKNRRVEFVVIEDGNAPPSGRDDPPASERKEAPPLADDGQFEAP